MSHGLLDAYKIISPAIVTAGVYYFTTDKGVQYEVRFGRRQDNILHATIVFGVINDEFEGEEYIVTNKGELYRVMATIVKVVKLFMEQHTKMVSYEFTGISKEGEDENRLSQRINLYKRYLPKIFDILEWRFDYSKGNTVLVNRI
ncbi:MAG: hypothetical protein JNL63_03025 [Bacteroidia bacterium]|nr:hypothetical protein [Bacteroidia bacterium]